MIKMSTWDQFDCTLGRLSIEGFHCFTLELPNKNNLPNISRIPRGTYEYKYRDNGRNGRVLELYGVKDRSYIQIHAGNYTNQIQGCILIGDGIKYINNDTIPDVTNSKNTLKKLLDLAGNYGTIEIK